MAKKSHPTKFNPRDWGNYFSLDFFKHHAAYPANAKKRALAIYKDRTDEHKEKLEEKGKNLGKALVAVGGVLAHLKLAVYGAPDLKMNKRTQKLDEAKIDAHIERVASYESEIERMLVRAVGTVEEKELKKTLKKYQTRMRLVREVRSGISKEQRKTQCHINTLLSLSDRDRIDIAQKIHRDAISGKIKKNSKFEMSRKFDYWDLGGIYANISKKPKLSKGKLDGNILERDGRLVLGHVNRMK